MFVGCCITKYHIITKPKNLFCARLGRITIFYNILVTIDFNNFEAVEDEDLKGDTFTNPGCACLCTFHCPPLCKRRVLYMYTPITHVQGSLKNFHQTVHVK